MAVQRNPSKLYIDLVMEDLRANAAQIARQAGNLGEDLKAAAIAIKAVYERTFHSPMPFIILGKGSIRDDRYLKNNFKLITSEEPKVKEKFGAILGGRQWSTALNDHFILAAINSGKEVHLTHERFPEDRDLWAAEKGHLTILGRELALLGICGYKLERRAHGLTLERASGELHCTYLYAARQLDTICSVSDIKDLFNRDC